MTTLNQICKGLEALLPPLTPGAPRASEAGFASAKKAKLTVKCKGCELVQYARWNCPRCGSPLLTPLVLAKTQEAR